MRLRMEDYPEGHPMRERLAAAMAKQYPARKAAPVPAARADRPPRGQQDKPKRNRVEQEMQIDAMKQAAGLPLIAVLQKAGDMDHFLPHKTRRFILYDWPALLGRTPTLRDVMYHTPNDSKRGKAAGGILKAMGMTSGVFDIKFMVPTLVQHGLYLEAKRPGEGLSTNQKRFRDMAEGMGYGTGTFTSFNELLKVVIAYLQVPLTLYPPQQQEGHNGQL